MAARKGRSKQAVRNGGWPAWAWLLAGLILGAILMFIVMRGGYMPITRQHNLPTANPQATPARGSAPGVADQASARQNAKKKPRYDFYSVLPEKEVVIPDAEISKQAKAESGNAQNAADNTAAAANAGYLLQVGSFPKASDADAMKAKLALQGFVAHVQPVSINGQTWNRVRLGPYASAAALEKDKNKLTQAGFHAIALKENK